MKYGCVKLALTKGERKAGVGDVLDNDTLMEYANAVHIERASKPPPPPQETPKKKAMNGDSMAVEPSKTVNPSPGLLDPENKLNAEEISMLRSESINSINNSSGRSSRLGRVFTAKHEKSSKSRRALLHKGNLPRGEVEMSIRYAEPTKKLVVQVLRAKQLLAWDKNGQCNPYATVGYRFIDCLFNFFWFSACLFFVFQPKIPVSNSVSFAECQKFL
ncbi:hypothetical protein OESDEN_16617 [Oesophagostomum dentatum]|uniref:Uncharacterized protein n=1 Tax=Oesophagostomum dentatum TaxID=61180 RepID=A0A0B1SJL0_OESDE|nr:hypothetical protein OESDEN_16617 [Oesophagostomum dentatum]